MKILNFNNSTNNEWIYSLKKGFFQLNIKQDKNFQNGFKMIEEFFNLSINEKNNINYINSPNFRGFMSLGNRFFMYIQIFFI